MWPLFVSNRDLIIQYVRETTSFKHHNVKLSHTSAMVVGALADPVLVPLASVFEPQRCRTISGTPTKRLTISDPLPKGV